MPTTPTEQRLAAIGAGLAEARARAEAAADGAGRAAREAAAAGDAARAAAAALAGLGAEAAALRRGLAREAAWGRGSAPSRLPFHLGGFRGLDELAGLLAGTPHEGIGLDNVMDYDVAGATFGDRAAATVRQWSGSIATRYLRAGKARSFTWTAHPFCGNGHKAPASWPGKGEPVPAEAGLCPSRPPTFTGAETPAERRDKQLRVWSYGADGELDPLWRAQVRAVKRDHFLERGIGPGHPIVFRLAHELDLAPIWGAVASPRCNSIGAFQTADDMRVAARALERFGDVFLETMSQPEPDLTGSAWPERELWVYFNPVKENFLPRACDIFLACPPNAELVGPDVYDHWRASMTDQEFAANAATLTAPPEGAAKPRWHRGLDVWRDWCRANGRLMAIGEFGVWSQTFAADGVSRPHPAEGWDNPVFVRNFLRWCADTPELVLAICFNVDIAAGDMPGHLIGPWPGIDDPSVPCGRTPLGDLNRCASRAFRAWARAAPLA